MLDHTYAEPQEKESSSPKKPKKRFKKKNEVKYRDSFSQVERANEGERLLKGMLKLLAFFSTGKSMLRSKC